jgi:gliding motility-associated-like protein
MRKLVLLTSVMLSGCLTFLSLSSSAQCPNINFISGNFNNWDCYTGDCGNGEVINPSPVTPGQHTIMDGPALINAGQINDEYCISIRKVPNGFKYAAKLGNDETGAKMEAIEYTMTVDSNNSLLMIHFAWVMQNPDNHSLDEQPQFSLSIRDSAGNDISPSVLPCAYNIFKASQDLPDLACKTPELIARDWTTVGYSLLPMLGKTIKIYFQNRDCTLSGHWGYAYVVAECRSMTIDLQYCAGATAARFRAPDGFKYYKWTRSTKPGQIIWEGEGRQYQHLTLTDAEDGEIVTCEVESALSTECSAQVHTVVKRTTISSTFGYGIMENGEVDFASNNYLNWYDTCARTATFVDRSMITNSVQANRSWSIHGLEDMTIPRDSMVTITFPDPGKDGLDSVKYLVRLTVDAENGCTDTSRSISDHYITIYASPRLEIVGDTAMCPGEQIELIAYTRKSQFVSYTWTGETESGNAAPTAPDSILTVTEPGTYYVSAVDVVNCVAKDTHVVTVNIPNLNPHDIYSPSCFGGNDGQFTHGKVTGGIEPYQSFIWLVTDANMWTKLDKSRWQYDPVENAYTDPHGNVNGNSYINLPAGTYIFYAVDANGCPLRGEVKVAEPPLLELSARQNFTSCGLPNGSIVLTAKGGTPPYTYTVEQNGKTFTTTKFSSGDSAIARGLDTGLYTVTVTDVGGNHYGDSCKATETIRVLAHPAPYLEYTTRIETCESANGYISLRLVNAFQDTINFIKMSWNGSKDTVLYTNNHMNLTAGNYTVTIIDGRNCVIKETINVGSHPTPVVEVDSTAETCGRKDGTITLTVESALPHTLEYLWEGRTEKTPYLTGLEAGVYRVVVNDSLCSVQREIEVLHVDGPTAAFQATSYSVPSNANFALTDISLGTVKAWNWDMGDGNMQSGKIVYHSYGSAGEYVITLLVIDENDCTDTASKTMNVYDELTVFIPNMFTPNGDEINPVWKPVMTEHVEEGYQLSIFDRWGQRIFYTTNPDEGWNGTGKDGRVVAANTVYSYRVIVRDFAGQEYEFVGQVTVIK